jgi:hypothetical protein
MLERVGHLWLLGGPLPKSQQEAMRGGKPKNLKPEVNRYKYVALSKPSNATTRAETDRY